jgi:NADP-dependent aldehyde dehydrogenase
VGTNAINRFARPLCYQDYPQELLPIELKDENERGIMRLVNGDFTREAPVNSKKQKTKNN